MPRPIICPHCRAELDIPPEFRGREVRCSECRNVFVPPAEVASPSRRDDRDRDDDRPARRPRSSDPDDDFQGRDRDPYADRDLDDRRPRPRKRKKSGNTIIWVLILGGIGFVVLGCGGCIALSLMIETPDLTTYTDSDNRFKADFPGKPVSRAEKNDDGLARTCLESKRDVWVWEETWFVHYVDLPKKPTDEDAILRKACDEFARKHFGASELIRTTSMHDGMQGMDLHLEHPDGNMTMVRFLMDGRRLYSVGIFGGGLSPDSMRVIEFWDSFKTTSTPDVKK